MSIETFNFTFKNSIKNNIDIDYVSKKENVFIQVFSGENKSKFQYIINEIMELLPNSHCIGTTTDGEILNKDISTNKTVININIFDETSINNYCSLKSNSYENGRELASNLIQKNTKLLIVFTDGTTSNGEEFTKGISSINKNIMIAGGMAGDNGAFSQTYVSCGNKILENGSVGVCLNSDVLNVYNNYSFNWFPIGIGHKINKVVKNRVYLIDDMTPVEFYKKYLGEDIANFLPSTGIEFPLIVYKNGIQIARAVIAKHDDGSLSFAGNLENNDTVRLGFGNAKMMINNSKKALERFNEINVEVFYLYSCMARRRYMPDLIQVEIEPFSKKAPTAGFFTYGEFYHSNNTNKLLNQTLTILALSENTNTTKHIDTSCNKNERNDYSSTLEALTHLIQQSMNDLETQKLILEEEKRYSQNLLNKQKLFMSHAIHETITPLTVIMNNIELYELENKKNTYLSNIEASMKNIFTIYDDLSYLVKNDEVKYPKHKINIVEFIQNRIDFFNLLAKQNKHLLDFYYVDDTLEIYFNETKLQRIIDNNITNAIKYTNENEKIRININNLNNTLTLIFSSKSNHIQHPYKVFDAYYRESNKEEGFGLGLNLVQKICNEENIEISLKSNEDITEFTYIFKEKDKYENIIT